MAQSMAKCKSLHLEEKLAEISDVLGRLSRRQSKVEASLRDLSDVLLVCAKSGENEVRNSCFSPRLGIVKAVLGILRCSSEVNTLAIATKCLTLLAHHNDEARTSLGELGAVSVLLQLLHPQLCTGTALWPEEWIPVYEEALGCLRKLTYHSASNQQELARVGGVKLIVDMAVDKNLHTNYGKFSSEAKHTLEDLVLRKKLICRCVSVPVEVKAALLDSFPALRMQMNMHYPAFYVDLVTKDGDWITHSMIEKGVVWPDSTLIPKDARWTCVGVENVEDGCNVWCQFCTEKPDEAITKMKNSLNELVSN